ncbi:GNAT family N-acetyltransferase [Actinophytocola sediminis]
MDVTPAPGAVIVDLADLGDQAFDQLYDDVLAPSFPETELLGRDVLRAQYLGDPSDFFGSAVLTAGRAVAVALCEHHRASGISLLNYLAVDPGIRQGGHGGRLLRHTLSRWETTDSVAFLAEVEDPRCHPSNDHGDPTARVRFYERHGAALLPLPYFQPSLGPGLARVPNLLLISLRTREAGLPSAGLTRFLDDNIAACEGEQARDHDPAYRALRDTVTAWPAHAPLWPLSRLTELPVQPSA